MSDELNEGISQEETLDRLEEKLEEGEFYSEQEADGEEYEEGEPMAAESEETEEQPEPIAAASQTEIQTAYNELAQYAQHVQQQESSVNWNKLRQEDPAAYANAVREFNEAKQQIAQREQQLRVTHEKLATESLQKEYQKLLKEIPEWKDENVANREKQEVKAYLKSQGYTEKEISNCNARDVKMARNAMLKDRGQVEQKKSLPMKKKAKRRIPGITRDAQKTLEQSAKHRPGKSEDIQLRLLRNGYA